MNDLLPHGLAKSQRPMITSDHYLTTTAQYHDMKRGSLPTYKRAPASDKVLYIQEFSKKLDERRWRPPLTMRNQISECQDEYRGLPVVEMKQPACGPKPPHLRQHDTNGPSKVFSIVIIIYFSSFCYFSFFYLSDLLFVESDTDDPKQQDKWNSLLHRRSTSAEKARSLLYYITRNTQALL